MTIYRDDLVVDIAPMATTRRGVSTHAVVATDALGRIRTWDAGAAEMFGCSSAEMLGRPVAEGVAAEASTLVEAMQATMHGQGWSGLLTIRHSGSAGAAPVCHVTVSPVIDDEGALLSVV